MSARCMAGPHYVPVGEEGRRPTSYGHAAVFVLALMLLSLAGAAAVAVFRAVNESKGNAAAMAGALDAAYPHEQWMDDNWDVLRTKTLWDLTLPGTHNSGNTFELGWQRMYAGDSRYGDYVTYARGQGLEPLAEDVFHARFVRWNVNHHVGVADQLRAGIRWFHLKLCNTAGAEASPSLEHVYHCHRGYTATTLASIMRDITQFLDTHPREFVMLGLNNLYGFSDGQRAQLGRAVAASLGRVQLVSVDEMRTSALDSLAAANKRVGVFVSSPGDAGLAVVDSDRHLYENWGPAGDSGDVRAYSDWLVSDIYEYATRHDRYYVAQANPNNNDAAMFTAVQAATSPAGLYGFEYDFLRGLAPLVLSAVRKCPGARIHAISTDFMHEARVTELALALTLAS